MSSPRFRLNLSSKAKRDIENILRYTEKTWGRAQVAIYQDKLNAALKALQENPLSGHQSADLPETHRLYSFGSHVIVYRIQPEVVGVARILHQRMSAARHI